MSEERPKLLILSFSKLESDARILKQINLFKDQYEVTTCGYGTSPDDHVNHVEVSSHNTKGDALAQALCLRTRQYKQAYWRTTYAREAAEKLKGTTFDAVIANDLDTVGVALRLVEPQKIHVDLHEFWVGIHDDVPAWTKLRKPFHEWMITNWVSQVHSVTTVNEAIADRYLSDYGVQCSVVTNASPYQEFEPTTTHEPIRLVHSGGAQPSRKIEIMMRAVARTQGNVTLDLYLVGTGTAYYQSLVDLAEQLGDRVRLLPPLPYSELLRTLNQYDVGLQVLAPTSTNNSLALPNKFFDYVQARLALVIGPTKPMVKVLKEFNLGVVTESFTEESLEAVLEKLSATRIAEWKQNSNAAASQLDMKKQLPNWEQPVVEIVQGKGAY